MERSQEKREQKLFQIKSPLQMKTGGLNLLDNRPKSSIVPKNQGVVQRTAFDDEIGTLVWTQDFDNKHFAESPEEAVEKGLSRVKKSAFKDSGARPDGNTVIIYSKDLLFYLKEKILSEQITGSFTFKAPLAYDVSGNGITILRNASFNVNVNEKHEINHLQSVEGGESVFVEKKSNVIKF